jgi:ferredoxin-NADP reductase
MNALLERLASPLALDAYLAALRPTWAPGRGVIEGLDPQTATATSVLIRPGRGWDGHRPGQFVTVGVDVAGVRHHRCYSLTSVPDRRDGRIEITVQAVEGGTVSRHLARHARVGDVVALGAADGDFTLADEPRPLLAITAGSGITPVMGIVRSLVASTLPRRDVLVLHHAPRADEVIFGAELARYAATESWLRVETVLTREPGGGHLDADRLAGLCPDWAERDAYVCGPTGLLDFATDHWSAAGAIGRLHVERFSAAVVGAHHIAAASPTAPRSSDPDGPDAASGTVRFASARIDALPASPTATLLDTAEAAGLAPPFGCRMGVCHTCSTAVLAGCARDLRDGRLVEAGTHVQLCVSTAAGDVTLDL